jgi:hypothetical protein
MNGGSNGYDVLVCDNWNEQSFRDQLEDGYCPWCGEEVPDE